MRGRGRRRGGAGRARRRGGAVSWAVRSRAARRDRPARCATAPRAGRGRLRRSAGTRDEAAAGGASAAGASARRRRPVESHPVDRPPTGRRRGPGRGGFPASVQPAPFGGASGYVQYIAPAGRVQVPGGQSSPARDRAERGREADRRAGQRQLAARHDRARACSCACSRSARARAARCRSRGRSPRSTTSCSRLLLLLALIGAGGIVLAAAAGGARRAHGAGADRALHRRTETLTGNPDLSAAPGGRAAATSWRAWRTASTRRSTRSSARWRPSATWSPTPGTSCARRSPACAPTSRCSEEAERLPAARAGGPARGHHRRSSTS